MLKVRFYSFELTGNTRCVFMFQNEDNHYTIFSGGWGEHTVYTDLFISLVIKS